MAEDNLGRKLFIWLLCPDHRPSLRETSAGTHADGAAGTEAEAWRNTTYLLVSCDLLSYLLMYIRAAHLGLVPSTVGGALLHQLLIKKVPHTFAHNIMVASSQLRFLCPR